MKVKTIKIYDALKNKSTLATKKELKAKLIKNGFILDDDNPDLVIAIGGDGSFIGMIKDNKYDTSKYYVGINCGKLGFLQNINPKEIDEFIIKLKKADYSLEEIAIQETEIITEAETKIFYAVNEILVRESNLDTVNFRVEVDDEFLEDYYGDGLLISTSTGSTAHGLSFGGAIVYNSFHAMQITPIAPLNSTAYRNIVNSIVLPEKMIIKLTPINGKDDIMISVDGKHFNIDKVKTIKINCKNKKIKCLRLNEYHFIKTINDKFLK